ncbi:DUF5659 domain-containing protein [Mediterraneibacter hominis]|uniref:DUF5659 domain-containing protein n=1 Tax=Mediterraneibacter hominis TaxID=2763054 RepID=UPI0038CBF612
MEKNNIFYCYSKRMSYFIRSFGIQYISIGFNKNTNTKYYIFEKSKQLDKIIQFYNEVKYKF